MQAVDALGIPDTLEAMGRSALADVDPAGTQLEGGYTRFDDPPEGVGFESQLLFQLAHDTGGQLLENYNDFGRATGALIERSSITYLLVIQPSVEIGRGKYRRLEVRLRDKAIKGRVLHRPGYYEPKAAGERSALEQRLDEADLLFGDRRIAELPVEVLAYPSPSSDPMRTVPLLVEVDGPTLVDGGVSPQLAIEAFVLGDDQSVHDVFSQQLKLDLDRVGAKLSEAPLRFLGAVRVPADEHRVRVRVRQEPSGKQFMATVTVAAAVETSDGPVVLPPLVLHPQDYSPLRLQAPAAAEVASAFQFGDVTVLPDLFPRLRPGEGRHVMVTVFGSQPDLSYRVRDRRGREVPVNLEWQHRSEPEDGELRLIGWLSTEGLEAGEYRLEVEAVGSGGAGRRASSGFQVVASR